MTIHNFYLFDKNGTLLYYAEWNRTKQSGMNREEEAKLMFGMLFSLKSFVNRISPTDPKEGFLYFKTSKYALNLFETATGLKFILNTDIASSNVRDLLQQIYTQLYVELVVKNPMCPLNAPITSELFSIRLDEFIRKSAIFSVKNN